MIVCILTSQYNIKPGVKTFIILIGICKLSQTEINGKFEIPMNGIQKTVMEPGKRADIHLHFTHTTKQTKKWKQERDNQLHILNRAFCWLPFESRLLLLAN